MNVDDVVMYKFDKGYSRWFGGQLGVVSSVSYAADGQLHCRVKWLQPVEYHGKKTSVSDFSADSFIIYSNEHV